MEYRKLGNSDLSVSILAMGCGRLGTWWQGRPTRTGRDAVRLALDEGITLFDTADVYGRGLSERLLGRSLAGHRADVVIATKCGLLKTPGAILRAVRSAPSSAADLLGSRRCYSSSYVVGALHASLRRLRTDYADILLLHSPPTGIISAGDFHEAFDRLKREGKVRAVGISARDLEGARAAIDSPGIDCVQMKVNLCNTAAIEEILLEAHRRGVGILGRQPLASGALLAHSNDEDDRSRVLRTCLHHAATRPAVSSVVTGMSRPDHVMTNVRALENLVPPGDHEVQSMRDRLCRSEP